MSPSQRCRERRLVQGVRWRCGHRVCLLKGCEQLFQPPHPLSRYCSSDCRAKARRWRMRTANRRYRASEQGKCCRRAQACRYRKRCRQRQTAAKPAPPDREGYRLVQPKREQTMAESLERYGQLSPVVVCLHEEDVLIDGFKRLRAARTLRGMTHLNARRLEVDEQGAKAAIYNLNRMLDCLAKMQNWLRYQGRGELQACDREHLESGFRRLVQEARLTAEASEDFVRELKLP